MSRGRQSPVSAPTPADRSAAVLRERGWGHGQQCSAADLAMTAPDGAALAQRSATQPPWRRSGAQRCKRRDGRGGPPFNLASPRLASPRPRRPLERAAL